MIFLQPTNAAPQPTPPRASARLLGIFRQICLSSCVRCPAEIVSRRCASLAAFVVLSESVSRSSRVYHNWCYPGNGRLAFTTCPSQLPPRRSHTLVPARALSIEAINLRGRWRSVESAKRYIQQGVVLLSTVSVPAAVARLGALFSDHVSDAIKAALPQQH